MLLCRGSVDICYCAEEVSVFVIVQVDFYSVCLAFCCGDQSHTSSAKSRGIKVIVRFRGVLFGHFDVLFFHLSGTANRCFSPVNLSRSSSPSREDVSVLSLQKLICVG